MPSFSGGGGGTSIGPSTDLQVHSLGIGVAASGTAGTAVVANANGSGFFTNNSAGGPGIEQAAGSATNINGTGFTWLSINAGTGRGTLTAGFPLTVATSTVGSLPAGTLGDVMQVSDGTAALAWGATVTGGASTKYLVWFNGAAWTVVGK